jgi:hypothetical protein
VQTKELHKKILEEQLESVLKFDTL